ncbi:unnamed protein product [Hymenolepis diminuta]|uniref:Uncharacterized protein n=1 Tax=Hymenolepis diminuta TaxID=6216 RepID=A0A564YN43_HYMDI|nr:unnamed protein product [Hymenolepis diminuta]
MLTGLIESPALELTTGSAVCNRSRREQARTSVQRPPQPINNQDPCSLARFCI